MFKTIKTKLSLTRQLCQGKKTPQLMQLQQPPLNSPTLKLGLLPQQISSTKGCQAPWLPFHKRTFRRTQTTSSIWSVTIWTRLRQSWKLNRNGGLKRTSWHKTTLWTTWTNWRAVWISAWLASFKPWSDAFRPLTTRWQKLSSSLTCRTKWLQSKFKSSLSLA